MAKQPHASTVKHSGENKGQNTENKGQNTRDMGVLIVRVLGRVLFVPSRGCRREHLRTKGGLDMAQAQIVCKNTYKWSVQIHAEQNESDRQQMRAMWDW